MCFNIPLQGQSMKRILITGSTDGLGLLAAQELTSQGHQVVLHARNKKRAEEVLQKMPNVESCVIGDLGDIEETKHLASQINALGTFDAVIHNAGVYNASPREILFINVLAPYILTCLIQKPERLIYLSSEMHLQGHPNLKSLESANPSVSYSDSKLFIWMLCKAVARRWSGVFANTVDPGWVPTKMGGPNAPDDLQQGYETQVWLAVSDESQSKLSGQYFFHKKVTRSNPEGDDIAIQDELLKQCAMLTGIRFPGNL